MVIGVSAWFDVRTESAVRDIWRMLADAGISRTLHHGPYRPHVTLAVYETIDRPTFTAALRRHLASVRSFPVVFSGLGVFLNNPPTAFLSVTLSERLRQLHCDAHELLEHTGRGAVAYHLRDRWNPHCSLALELPGPTLPKAVEFLRTLSLPFEGLVDRVGIIDTPAEIELDVVPLAAV